VASVVQRRAQVVGWWIPFNGATRGRERNSSQLISNSVSDIDTCSICSFGSIAEYVQLKISDFSHMDCMSGYSYFVYMRQVVEKVNLMAIICQLGVPIKYFASQYTHKDFFLNYNLPNNLQMIE